jgi:hypothetical protein
MSNPMAKKNNTTANLMECTTMYWKSRPDAQYAGMLLHVAGLGAGRLSDTAPVQQRRELVHEAFASVKEICSRSRAFTQIAAVRLTICLW